MTPNHDPRLPALPGEETAMEMYIYCGTPEQWHTATAYRADVLPSWMREHLARFPATTVTAYDDEAPVWLPVRDARPDDCLRLGAGVIERVPPRSLRILSASEVSALL